MLTYFITKDITKFNPRILPKTQARDDLIEANRSPSERWLKDNIELLKEGMSEDDIRLSCPKGEKKDIFMLFIQERCTREVEPKSDQIIYKIKEELIKYYE